MPKTSVAARLRRRTLPSALKIISAAGMVSSVASRSACAASTRRRDSDGDAGQLARFGERQRELALADLQRLDHLRERIDQDADFIRPQCLVRGGEVAHLDAMRGLGQPGQWIENDFLGREHDHRNRAHAEDGEAGDDAEEQRPAPEQQAILRAPQLARAAVELLQQLFDRLEIALAGAGPWALILPGRPRHPSGRSSCRTAA